MTKKDLLIMSLEHTLGLMFTIEGSREFRMSLPKLTYKELKALEIMLNR